MAKQSRPDTHTRRAIAAQAARLMAQDGIPEFGLAKRKAARQLGFAVSEALPSNDEVEIELRAYLSLYQHDQQQARLASLRQMALDIMSELTYYRPCLTGSVWNGTAGPDAAIDIVLFADSIKMVEVWLLDAEVPYRVSERPHFNRALERSIPVITFDYDGFVVNLLVYGVEDQRGALLPDTGGRAARGDLAAVQSLLRETSELAAAAGSLAAIP